MTLIPTTKDVQSIKRNLELLSLKASILDKFDLTSSRLVSTNSQKKLASVTDLTSWIAATVNQTTVTDDTDGTITIGTVQDIHVDAHPEFAGLTIKDSNDDIVMYADENEFYIGEYSPAAHVAGSPMGLLLVLTYS